MIILIKFFCFIAAIINVFIYFQLNIFLTIAFIIIASSLFISIIIDFNKADTLKSNFKKNIKDIKEYSNISINVNNKCTDNKNNINNYEESKDKDLNVNYLKLIVILLIIIIALFVYDRYDDWKTKYHLKEFYNDIFSEYINNK